MTLADVAGARLRVILAPPPAVGGSAEAHWALTRILLVFLVARIIVLACAIGVETFVTPDPAGPGGSLRQGSDRPILASLTSWDGVYYLGIAADGYQVGPVNGPYPEVAFFPLYPTLVHLAAPVLGGDLPLAAVMVSNVAALVALVVVYQLARIRLAPQAAMLATTLVAIQPGAVAFSMAYSDSLFLLLACGSMLCAERGWRPAAGTLAMFAALTRLPGVLLAVPLLMIFARQDGRRPRRSWLWALGAPLGLCVFGVAMEQVAGDALAPIRAQDAWEYGRIPDATTELWVLAIATVVYGGVALTIGRALWDRWRAGPPSILRPGVGWGLLNVMTIAAAHRLQSLPRYLAPITSAAEQLASGAYQVRVVGAVVAASLVGYTVLALLHFGLRLAP